MVLEAKISKTRHPSRFYDDPKKIVRTNKYMFKIFAHIVQGVYIMSYAVRLVILFLFIGVAIWLQITLSKNKNKWLGLILPLLNFAYSIIAIFPLFKSITLPQYYEKFDKYGKLIETVTVEASYNILGFILKIFFICNITTLIFCIIYWVYRNKRRQKIQ